ncbi:hypothetical protein EVAR_24069_1 [Eumeta japonica]|uniref:Uncharacterized protein n=1 Tax=Eumeta variegata TaxID=151549 RepID=A0A4C1VU78_EUMVA|nr:hypothetical protein EVAR_24069_1 [Eumeta japonica]
MRFRAAGLNYSRSTERAYSFASNSLVNSSKGGIQPGALRFGGFRFPIRLLLEDDSKCRHRSPSPVATSGNIMPQQRNPIRSFRFSGCVRRARRRLGLSSFDSYPTLDNLSLALDSNFETASYCAVSHVIRSNFSPTLDFELGPILDFEASRSRLSILISDSRFDTGYGFGLDEVKVDYQNKI